MKDRIAVMREAITKITQLLSDKNIRVTQMGSKAEVLTDGKGLPVGVNLPYIPDNAPEALVEAVQGFLDSQVSQILYRDFSLTSKVQGTPVGKLAEMIEMPRVENQMTSRFRGSRANLDRVAEFYLNNHVRPQIAKLAKEGKTKHIQSLMMPTMMRALSGQRVFRDFVNEQMAHVKDVWDKLAPHEAEIQSIKSTADAIKTASVVYKEIEEDDAPPSDDNDENSLSGKGGKSGKSGKSGGGGKGEKGDSESEDDSESEGGKDGGEGEDEDSDGTDEGGEGKGKGEDSEGDGSENEESESDGGGGDGGEGEEGEGDSEDDVEDTADSKLASGSPSRSEGEGNPNASTGFSEMLENSDPDISSKISDEIEKQVNKAAKEAKYLPFTKDYDRVGPIDHARGRDEWVKNMTEEVDHMVGPMQKDLERAIAARSLSTWSAGHRSGRIAAANLSRLAVGDDRVFRRKQTADTKDTAVSLLVDASGSMCGQKIDLAIKSAYALSSVLERIGIAHEVLTFTTTEVPSELEQRVRDARIAGAEYSRYEPLNIGVIKGFSERNNAVTKKRFTVVPHNYNLANNIDGECVEIAGMRLAERREKRKILIVLSDGWPSCWGNRSQLYWHLEQVVERLTKAKIDTVGIGIMDSAVERFYPKNVVISNVSELPVRVIKELRAALIGK